jgi:hypothetical protein
LSFLFCFHAQFTASDEGLKAGTAFGYGEGMVMSELFEPVQGSFSLSTSGEQIHLYCLEANGDPRPLYAFSYNGDWAAPELPSYNFDQSALPQNLEGLGNVVLESMSNYVYDGPTDGSNEDLKLQVTNPVNWLGSSTDRFQLGSLPDSAARPSDMTMVAGLIVSSLVSMLFC